MPIEGSFEVKPTGMRLCFKKDISTLNPCQWVVTKRFARREYVTHVDDRGKMEIKAIEKKD